MVSVLFLPAYCILYFLLHLDRLRITDIPHRKTRLARRFQRNHLRIGVFSFFQRDIAKACTTCRFGVTHHISLRRSGVEHVSPVCSHGHFLGGTPRRGHGRHLLCLCLQEERSATSRPLRRPVRGRRRPVRRRQSSCCPHSLALVLVPGRCSTCPPTLSRPFLPGACGLPVRPASPPPQSSPPLLTIRLRPTLSATASSVLSVALFCKPKSVIKVPSGFILLPCSGTKGLGKPKKDNSIPVGRSNDRFGFIRLMPPPSSEVRSFFTRICFGPMPRKRDRRSPSLGGRPTGGKISAKPHPASVDLRDASLLPSKWSEKHICMTV